VGIVECQCAIKHRRIGRSRDVEFATSFATHGNVCANEETVDEAQWAVVQIGSAVEVSVVVVIGAFTLQHLQGVGADISVGIMLAVALRHIECFHAHVAQLGIFENEAFGLELSSGRESPVLVVIHHVHIAAQHALKFWQIRHHVGELAKIEIVDAQCDVVDRVGRSAVDAQSRAVVGQKIHVGLDVFVLAEEDEILVVDVKAPVGNDRIIGREGEVETIVDEVSPQPQVNTLAALAVGEVDVRPDTRIMDIGTETRRELIGVLAQIIANGAIEIKARRVL